MSPKVLIALIGVVVVAGGYFAVQSLQTKVDIDEPAETVERAEQSDSDSGSRASDGDDDAQVSSIGDSTRSRRRTLSERTIKRGAGAAAIDVTPATGTPAATRAPNSTPTPEEVRQENRSIADLTNMFKNTSDPDAKIDIADQLGSIDSPEAIKSALELLRNEKDPAVQEALLEAMQGLASQEEMADEIFKQVAEIYTKTDDPDVKIAAQDLMGDLATKEAAAGLKQVVSGSDADAGVKVSAAENLLRISQGEPDIVSPQEATVINDALKEQYKSGDDAAFRQQVIMAMAIKGKENLAFFQQALQTEQDPQIKQMLERLVTIYTAPPPQPPPGTAVTPVPTP